MLKLWTRAVLSFRQKNKDFTAKFIRSRKPIDCMLKYIFNNLKHTEGRPIPEHPIPEQLPEKSPIPERFLFQKRFEVPFREEKV